jgi:hypothetical protein
MAVSVGSAAKGEKELTDEQEHLEGLKAALLRLPKIHLYVLDALVLHLRTLVSTFLSVARFSLSGLGL